MTADEIIAHFGLAPHPEGGWYREIWRAEAAPGVRPVGTSILFLLRAGEHSHWHRVDADEIWHFHAGHPLELRQKASRTAPEERGILGIDLGAGQSPQLRVPPGVWQAARTLGDWTLVGCTVAPGFQFEGFELAPPDF